jgi:hypothetical protein
LACTPAVTPQEESASALRLRTAVIASNRAGQAKFSELSLDAYRVALTLEMELRPSGPMQASEVCGDRNVATEKKRGRERDRIKANQSQNTVRTVVLTSRSMTESRVRQPGQVSSASPVV